MVTLNWFIANQPGGSIQEVAKRCTDESNGSYKVEVQLLPAAASDQREQLVRRLAARDSTVDIIGMDVIWTAEFANAGWIRSFPQPVAKRVTKGDFPSVIKTATFEGKIYLSPKIFELMASDHTGQGSGVERDYFYFPGDGFGMALGFAVRTDPVTPSRRRRDRSAN